MEVKDRTQTSLGYGPKIANRMAVGGPSSESVKLHEESDHYVPYEDYIPGRDI